MTKTTGKTARKTNWFAITITLIIIAIIAGVTVAVTVANSRSDNSSVVGTQTPRGTGIDQQVGALTFGSGPHTVDVYLDFMCPYCNQFEQTYDSQLQKLAKDNRITFRLHPVNLLDRFSTTSYSSRSASALFSAAEKNHDAVIPYMRALYAHQPAENSAGLSDNQLIQYAKESGVDIASSQSGHPFVKFVSDQTKNTMPADPADGNQKTPTVVIDGTYMPLETIDKSATYFTDRFGE
jgi:protein-disulfide isomerase